MQPFWYFPVKQLVQKWLNIQRFEGLRQKAVLERRGGYMDGEEFSRLDRHQESYAIAMSSIVCTLVSCVVKDPRAEEKRGPRNTDWFDRADAGKVFLVRSANTSRFN